MLLRTRIGVVVVQDKYKTRKALAHGRTHQFITYLVSNSDLLLVDRAFVLLRDVSAEPGNTPLKEHRENALEDVVYHRPHD